MIIFKKVASLQAYLFKQGSVTTGFVPTMGALHSGHLSLVARSREVADTTVVSIFINPDQFNNAEDFNKYPVNLENDIYLLEKAGCNVLFLPSVEEMYPVGLTPTETFELGYLETILEGKYRPGHFQGVSKVIKRLLDIIRPGYLVMGQKDYQQCRVVAKLLQLLPSHAQLVICPTLREEGGLAMSSRNLRLNGADKITATEIYKAINFIREGVANDPVDTLRHKAFAMLEHQDFKVDYIEVADAGTLLPVEQWDGTRSLVILAAAYLGKVRLIDNVIM